MRLTLNGSGSGHPRDVVAAGGRALVGDLEDRLHGEVAADDAVSHVAGPRGLRGVGRVTAGAVVGVLRGDLGVVVTGRAVRDSVTRCALLARGVDRAHPTGLRVDGVDDRGGGLGRRRGREGALRTDPGRDRVTARVAPLVGQVTDRAAVAAPALSGRARWQARSRAQQQRTRLFHKKIMVLVSEWCWLQLLLIRNWIVPT